MSSYNDNIWTRLAMSEVEDDKESIQSIQCDYTLRLLEFPLKQIDLAAIAARRKGKRRATRRHRTIANRLVAILWVINPKLFGGKSLSAVARGFGIRPPSLAAITSEFSREFGVRAPWQRQGNGTFKNASSAKLGGRA